MKIIDSFFRLFGFDGGFNDYLDSTFHVLYIQQNPFNKIIIFLTFLFSSSLLFVKNHMGVGASFFIIFCILLIAEFLTGIIASARKKQDLNSKKGVRFIIKTGTYLLLIILFHSFYEELNTHEGLESKIYAFMMRNIYYFILINVVLWTVISVEENLKKGWDIDLKISSKIKEILLIFKSKNKNIQENENN